MTEMWALFTIFISKQNTFHTFIPRCCETLRRLHLAKGSESPHLGNVEVLALNSSQHISDIDWS